jgi:Type III flagellar switch regulator (C-ring) FliN C-term
LSVTTAPRALQAVPWRPLGEADLRVAHEHVQTVLDGFSTRWFVQARLVVDEAVLVPPGQAVPTGLLAAGPLRLAARPDAFTALARLALDLRDSAKAAPAHDPLLQAFACRLRDDLLAALSGACSHDLDGPEAAAEGSTAGALRLAIELPAATRSQTPDTLDLWCPLAALIGWRPLPQRPGSAVPRPLVSRKEAWQGTVVRVEAVVGSVQLPATSLVELEPGDVLVLDRALGEACALRESLTKRVVARGMLRKSGEHYGVELHSAL